MKLLVASFLIVLSNIGTQVFAAESQVLRGDFEASFKKVNENIYRSRRPDYEDLQAMKNRGIKTIINLENDPVVVRNEKTMAESLGFKFFSFPMSWITTPSDDQVDEILAAMQNQDLFPLVIHCKFGKDRTGLMVGLYRVLAEEWSRNRAHEEMVDYGFHVEYIALENYFWDRTQSH